MGHNLYRYVAAQDLITVTTTTTEGSGKEKTETESVKCLGAEIVQRDTGERTRFLSCCTLLAAGGAGQLFPSTTNPSVSTGDGVAMAVRGHAAVANMEFYQFHPTSLYTGPGGARKKAPRENAFLVTEAVRGHGGRLYNGAGERFMSGYDDRLELAPRDVVARAIDCEIKAAAAAGNEAGLLQVVYTVSTQMPTYTSVYTS
jgi:L-aspartate oxidase